MDILYERPREKLQKRGVAALSNVELLQVIIGSGTAGMPVAKIARKVERLLRKNTQNIALTELITIPGLGKIKAGQIIASIELAQRLALQVDTQSEKEIDVLADIYNDVRTAKKPTLLYVLFNGAGEVLNDNMGILKSTHSASDVVREVFADALAQSAASVLIIVGHSMQSLEPSMYELDLARNAYATASLLSVPLKSFSLINQQGEYTLKEANRG